MKITLKTLPDATAQEVFDQVARHLLTQQERSVAKSESVCLYRSSDGLKCAAGCLISDDEYNEGMEGGDWNSLIRNGIAPKNHKGLILYLQLIHDSYSIDKWPDDLIETAETFGLNADVVEEFL